MKLPLPRSAKLLERVEQALTQPLKPEQRRPLLIVVDGADGCGKSHLASWLAWQLGIRAVQLDLYLISGTPTRWRSTELERVIALRIDDRKKPMIVEGALVLDALAEIGRKPDFLVFVEGEGGGGSVTGEIPAYRSRHKIPDRADFTIDGYDDEIPPR